MASCAIEPCDQSRERGGPGCRMCDVIAKIQIVRCVGLTQEEQKACGLVAGHDGPCRRGTRGHVAQPDLKAAAPLPDLSAPRAAAIALGRIRRHRVGPHH